MRPLSLNSCRAGKSFLDNLKKPRVAGCQGAHLQSHLCDGGGRRITLEASLGGSD